LIALDVNDRLNVYMNVVNDKLNVACLACKCIDNFNICVEKDQCQCQEKKKDKKDKCQCQEKKKDKCQEKKKDKCQDIYKCLAACNQLDDREDWRPQAQKKDKCQCDKCKKASTEWDLSDSDSDDKDKRKCSCCPRPVPKCQSPPARDKCSCQPDCNICRTLKVNESQIGIVAIKPCNVTESFIPSIIVSLFTV